MKSRKTRGSRTDAPPSGKCAKCRAACPNRAAVRLIIATALRRHARRAEGNPMTTKTACKSFRIVCQKDQVSLAEELLASEGFRFSAEGMPFCRRLEWGPFALGSSLAAFFGLVYIQNRSSMLPPLALGVRAGGAALDMCASPGGKSTYLAQLAGPEGFVLANEPPGPRLGTLRANLQRACLPNLASCACDGRALPPARGGWESILLDAPCSGWGTAEKNPRAPRIWRGRKLDRLTELQRGLLRRAAALLAPGGRLLYSTCTTNEAENEAQTRFARDELGLEPQPLQGIDALGFTLDRGREGVRVLAEKGGAQGFYLSLLQKPGTAEKAATGDAPAPEGFAPFRSTAPDCPFFDPETLGMGSVRVFGREARFLHRAALEKLPENFAWQAPLLGSLDGAGGFAPAPRSRGFLRPDASPAVRMDEPGQLRALLDGRQVESAHGNGRAAIFFRGLPLGVVSIKNGRVIAGFR